MNIYEILFKHYSPKDSEEGIKRLLVAKDAEEVFEYIKSEPKGIYTSWHEEDRDEEYEDQSGNPKTFKERMLRLEGGNV